MYMIPYVHNFQLIEDLEKQCLQDHKRSCEYKSPIKSLQDGLLKDEQILETVSEYFENVTRQASCPSHGQKFIEVAITLTVVGLLMLLCYFKSKEWLTRFSIEMLNVHSPL